MLSSRRISADVVSQRHKFGIPFVFFLGAKNYLVFLTFPYPVPLPKNCVIFIGCNFESRASQVGLQKQKIDTASAKEEKVSLQLRGRQSQGCALSFGARSPEATKTWPRATENIFQVTQAGDMLVLVS